MNFDLENMFKRYVGNKTKTPYFVAVEKLSREQARNEIFPFVVLQSVLLGLFSVTSLSDTQPHGGAAIVTAVALALMVATITFGVTKAAIPATLAALAPVSAGLYCAVFGFHPRLSGSETLILVAMMLAWARYCWRILAIARAFPDMPPGGSAP